MSIENSEEIKIRKFLKSLTTEEIADSVHLLGFDFETCDIDLVVEATYSLFLEVLNLKKMLNNNIKSNNQEKVIYSTTPQSKEMLFRDYEAKKKVLKKLRSCSELDELLLEKAFSDYAEKNGDKKILN